MVLMVCQLLSQFILGNTCIGANWIGRILYGNLIVFSENLEIINDAHLTFHIGEDGAWLSNNFNDFDAFNKAEVYKSLESLYKLSSSKNKKESLKEVFTFMENFGKPKQKDRNSFSFFKALFFKLKRKIKSFIKALTS